MKRHRITRLSLAAGATLLASALPAAAQSVDALLDTLVNKGVLTVKEANDLREKSDQDFSTAFSSKTGVPDWVTAFKINGDFRGRYESFNANNPNFVDQGRWRYRARIGFVAVMKENFEVGIKLGSGNLDGGIPTGGIDPISNNQTMQNNGSKKGIFIDQAYAKWAPLTSPDLTGAITFGKMQNPLLFTPLVFDNDYTPEGGAIQLGRTIGSRHNLTLASGAFILDEIGSSSKDPFMFDNQLILNSTWSPKLSTSLGAAFLWISHPEQLGNDVVPNINVGNTRQISPVQVNGAGGYPSYDFNPLVLDASATYTLASFPMYPGAFPITVAGEGMINPAVPSQDLINGVMTNPGKYGYNAGITFGKAGKKGTWELSYNYRYLGANSWYEELTDSDFGAFYQVAQPSSGLSAGYRSGTNVKGNILKLAYSPFDMLTLSATWFRTSLINEQLISSSTTWDSSMNRIQIDAMLKF
jgi:hypothetical protein